MGTLKPQYGD